MAIIYSYPKVVQPALSDLLIGTDVSTKNKVTKSFSIQSIVDLVEPLVPGGGTVTTINTDSSTFVTLSGGPISTTGTITASLSATGTPSSQTFLRGDNTWAVINQEDNITYSLSSAQNGSAANIDLVGSTGSQSIVTLFAGANISLTDNGSNGITITSTASGGGGDCCSVNAGNGLKIQSGTPASNPVIGVDYTGSNNFILKGESQTTITEQDYIPFNDISSGSVKTTTMGVIPPSALSLVKQYIDAGDANDVTNSSDSFTTTAKVQKIVSLTSSEYASITPDANTLYLIVGALPTFTVTLAFTNTISGTEYTIGGDQVGSTQEGISGSSYAFNTTITPNPGFYFSSGPTVTNAAGTITTNETVYTLISGTVEAVPTPQCTATLFVNTSGITGSQYTLGGDLSGAQETGDCPLDITGAFNTTITANSGYQFTTGPVIENATGVISGDQVVETCITGVIEPIPPSDITVTPNTINNFTSNGYETQVTLSATPGSISGSSPLDYSFTGSAVAASGYEISGLSISGETGTATSSGTVDITFTGTITPVEITVTPNVVNQFTGESTQVSLSVTPTSFSGYAPVNYSFTPSATANSGYIIENLSFTGDLSGAATSSKTATIYANGNIVAEQVDAIVELVVDNNITGGAEGVAYTLSGDLQGAQQTGAVPLTYDFTTNVSVASGYEFITGPTVSNANGVTSQTGLQYATTTISGEVGEKVDATLSVVESISGEQVYTITGDTSGTVQSGLPPFDYVFATGVSIPSGYEWTSGPTITPAQPNTGTISTDATITTTVSGTIAEVIEQGTVSLSFTNNVTGKENTSTTVADGGNVTIQGNVGDPYTIENSISANSGYEFTNGPTWSTGGNGTVTGTFQSGTINIEQTVSGEVTAIAVPQYYALQKCSTGGSGFTTNLNTDDLTLSTGDIVVDTAPNPDEYYTVLADRPTVQGSTFVSLTGLQSCPTPLYYYNVVQCDGTGTDKVSSEVPNLTTDYSYTYNSVCYSIVDTDVTQNPSYDITGLPTGCCTETLTSFTTTSIAQSTGADACAQPKTQTRSHDGSGALPTTNDTVYLGSTVGSGNVGAGFWGLTNDTYYQTNSGGTVTSVQDCPVVPGTIILDVVNQVANSSYSVNPSSQSITGSVGDPYTFTTTATADPGYEFVSGSPLYNGSGTGIESGTIQSGTNTITQTITGTTVLSEYYELQKCSTGGFGFTTAESTNQVSFSTGDIVLDTAEGVYYTVLSGRTTTQGSQFVEITALQSCPAQLYYYNAVQCSGTGTARVSSEDPNLTSADSYTYNSVCYKIVDSDPTQNPDYNITGLVDGCCVVNGTVNLTVTNQVANSSYTVNPSSQTITDPVGDPYTFTTTVVPNSGYELVPGTIQYNGLPNGIQSGTISAGTTEITQTITGQTRLLEYYTLTKCDPNGGPGFVSFVDIYDSINGTVTNPPLSNGDTVYDAGNDYYYTVTGRTTVQGSTGLTSYTGGTGCPAPLYYYNVVQCSGTGTDKVSSEVPNLTSDYSYTYNSVCYKIVDTDPTQTPSYDITSLPSGCCTATVNVNFTNSVVGKANTTTTIADGATESVTGTPGDTYTIVNSISVNSGYEFTSGPTWSTGGTGTVTGTFVSGTTNISQDVTGNVQAISLTSFTTNASPEASSESACAAVKEATRYHTGSGTYPTDGDTLYQTNNLGSPVGAGYWGLVNGTYVLTDSSSEVIESGLCI